MVWLRKGGQVKKSSMFQWVAMVLVVALRIAQAQSLERLPKPYPNFAPDWMAVDAKGVITAVGDGKLYYVDAKDAGKKFTGRGTYWSADQGKTWTGDSSKTAINADYNGIPIKVDPNYSDTYMTRYAFVAHPDGDLFAVQVITMDAGLHLIPTVFRSKDHGFTWSNTIDSLPATPVAGNTGMFVAPNGSLFYWTSAGFYVSGDKGKTWVAKTDPTKASGNTLAGSYLRCVADPESQVYCDVQRANKNGNRYALIVRSRDEGATWDSLPTKSQPSNGIFNANRKGMIASFGSQVGPGGCLIEVDYLPESDPLSMDSSVCGGGSFGGPYITDIAITPDGGVLGAATYAGIAKWDNALKTKTSLNPYLGSDSASNAKFLDDSIGDLFAWLGPDLFLYHSGSTGIKAAFRKAWLRMSGSDGFDDRSADAMGRIRDKGRKSLRFRLPD
jgi:hypothetical protein